MPTENIALETLGDRSDGNPPTPPPVYAALKSNGGEAVDLETGEPAHIRAQGDPIDSAPIMAATTHEREPRPRQQQQQHRQQTACWLSRQYAGPVFAIYVLLGITGSLGIMIEWMLMMLFHVNLAAYGHKWMSPSAMTFIYVMAGVAGFITIFAVLHRRFRSKASREALAGTCFGGKDSENVPARNRCLALQFLIGSLWQGLNLLGMYYTHRRESMYY